MREREATEGPWHVAEHEVTPEPGCEDCAEGCCGEHLIWPIHWTPDPGDGLCSHRFSSCRRTLADARLVAAAPELEHVLGWLVSFHDDGEQIDDEWWKAAREALDKARKGIAHED